MEWPERLGAPAAARRRCVPGPGARAGREEARIATLDGWPDRMQGCRHEISGTLPRRAWLSARPSGGRCQADASLRRYARLVGGPRPALLMDAPPPEDVRPFARLARHLLAAGLSVPEIIAADEAAGFLLARGFRRRHPCRAAGCRGRPDRRSTPRPPETLAALHAAPVPPGLPAWDAAAMARATAATFLDWWWPAAFGAPPAPRCGTGWRRRWARCWRPSRGAAASSTATTSRPT